MPLLKARTDDAPDGTDKVRFVTLDEWRDLRAAAPASDRCLGQRLGLRLASDETGGEIGDEISGDLERFAVIALEFPRFTDGRAYSTARLLRERYGYRGEIRAVGEVLRDQLLFMRRCGFDAFELARDIDAESLDAALAEISVVYQPAADARRPAYALRHHLPDDRRARADEDRGGHRSPARAEDGEISTASPARVAVAANWAY